MVAEVLVVGLGPVLWLASIGLGPILTMFHISGMLPAGLQTAGHWLCLSVPKGVRSGRGPARHIVIVTLILDGIGFILLGWSAAADFGLPKPKWVPDPGFSLLIPMVFLYLPIGLGWYIDRPYLAWWGWGINALLTVVVILMTIFLLATLGGQGAAMAGVVLALVVGAVGITVVYLAYVVLLFFLIPAVSGYAAKLTDDENVAPVQVGAREAADSQSPGGPIEMSCPGCGTRYFFGQHLAGRMASCRGCKHLLTVGDGAVDEDSLEEAALTKHRGRGGSMGLAWKLPVGFALFLLFIGGGATFALQFAGSLGGPKVVGTWTGSPEVRPVVRMPRGKMPPVAEGIAEVVIQKAADEFLAVNIEFKRNGTVVIFGNTEILGVVKAADGTWEILERDGNTLTVLISLPDTDFQAQLEFERRSSFTFSRLDIRKKAIVFKRAR
jgi:hypothetical protein